MGCNTFYSDFRSVKSVEYLKPLFISFGNLLVALEGGTSKFTKGCLMSEKIESK